MINQVIEYTSIYSFYFLLCNSKNSNRLFFYVNIASVTAISVYHRQLTCGKYCFAWLYQYLCVSACASHADRSLYFYDNNKKE